MTLALQLDRDSTLPLYQQIVEQIKTRIGDGRLPTGSRLPPVRQMAGQLGVTRLTVHNAYSELQSGGWVEATVGRGTFVSESVQAAPLLARVGKQLTPDGVMDDMPRITQMPSLRSLAYADPDPALSPVGELWAALSALRPEAGSLLQYGPSQGDGMLRVEVAALLRERGIDAGPDEIIVTSGASQALALVTEALAQPGDCVAVEAPTYLGFLQILKARGIRAVAAPMDEEGVRLEALERLIVQERPRFFYTIPTYHNPTGTCMSAERRQALLALAERYGVLVVEDDVYGRIALDEAPPPPLKASDRRGQVVYVDSISKIMLPGLRIGFLVAPSPLHERLLSLRRASDLCGPPLLERALAGFLQEGRLKAHLRHALPLYRERRDTLLRGLQRWMPEDVRWTTPRGGFCCWLTLPLRSNPGELYQAALARGVAFTPGEVFLTEPGRHQHLRLCFGSQPPEVIHESLSVLGELITQRLEQRPAASRRSPAGVPLV